MIDTTTKQTFFQRENSDATDIYRGVKCARCGEPLGLLANIDEVPDHVN
jgi:hypothetical protein